MHDLSPIFSALSDSTRRAILARLTQGEATVLELARPFALSQPAISKHLKVLETAGLIERRVAGNTRPCRIRKEGLEAAGEWLGKLRQALTNNYNRLDQLLVELQSPKEEEHE